MSEAPNFCLHCNEECVGPGDGLSTCPRCVHFGHTRGDNRECHVCDKLFKAEMDRITRDMERRVLGEAEQVIRLLDDMGVTRYGPGWKELSMPERVRLAIERALSREATP